MKMPIRAAGALVLAAGLLLAVSCSSAGAGGGANAYTTVTGSIDVADSSYWSQLKLGVFSKTANSSHLDYSDNISYPATGDATKYRLIYHSLYDGSALQIAPVSGSSSTIQGSGATQRTYTFELPSTLPATDDIYYYAAWLDTNGDGKLGMADSATATVIETAEFNRLAYKNTVNSDDEPTVIHVNGFSPAGDLSGPGYGDYTGQYKYSGYDEASTTYNDYQILEASNSAGFNFNISANTGW